jgi:hypothetical protein
LELLSQQDVKSAAEEMANEILAFMCPCLGKPNVRDQRRRALGAPLAGQNLWIPLAGTASGVTTRDDRCIA